MNLTDTVYEPFTLTPFIGFFGDKYSNAKAKMPEIIRT